MLTKVPKSSTVFIIVGHQKTFYRLGNVELFRCLSNKFLVDNLRERYETHRRAEIPEPPAAELRLKNLPLTDRTAEFAADSATVGTSLSWLVHGVAVVS
jgi:hypothetical protein